MAPAYRENESPPRQPIGELEGNGGRDMGLEPDSGFWDWIHESRSLIVSLSETRSLLRNCLDLGFFIVGEF